MGKSGNAKIICPVEQILVTDLTKRTTIKKFSTAFGCSESKVYQWIRKGEIKSHTSAIHPDLTADNKILRLHFVMKKLYFDQLLNAIRFKDMSPIVRGDEKWFSLTKCSQRYYLVDGEDVPYRSCKSNRFITKIMFLAVVSRPTYKENGDVLFDGKIEIFPFTFEEPAKRNSRNRVVGTMVTKPIESTTRVVMKDYIINKIISAIKMKWSTTASKNVIILQDNAKPHITGKDLDFVRVATSDGWNIQLTQQPANSSDLNVLNLGVFRSISSLQSSIACTTVDELVEDVQDAYDMP